MFTIGLVVVILGVASIFILKSLFTRGDEPLNNIKQQEKQEVPAK
jgi:hypothetical protein